MKKYISLLICFTAMLVFVSCNDWLDVKPSNLQDRDKLFSTERGYGEAIRGVYAQLCGHSLYGRHLSWGVIDVFGGVYVYEQLLGNPWNAARQYLYIREDALVNSELIGIVESFWSNLYNAIAGLNSILGRIDDDRDIFTGHNYSVLKGEAIGLRAFLHFEILRLFGDVYEKSRDERVMPYVVELTPMVTPELTGGQIIDLIISELERALVLLENDPMRLGTTPSPILASAPSGVGMVGNNIYPWHNRRFHFNYYAAKATLARAYLWKGDKPNALRMAQEVIAEQSTHFPWVLSTNLANILLETSSAQDRTFATEHIFALNIMNLDDLIAGYHNNMGTGTISRNMFVNVWQFGSELGDPRYNFLTTHTINRFSTKYHQNPRVSDYFRNRLPLIRITEMYYIAAESSPTWEEGLEYLNIVRNYGRQLSSSPLSVNSPETLQEAILNEYRREFIGEGQLWHYYKRHQHTTIPNMTPFTAKGLRAYVFPRPENEDLYGNR
jgi:hypothetical protein